MEKKTFYSNMLRHGMRKIHNLKFIFYGYHSTDYQGDPGVTLNFVFNDDHCHALPTLLISDILPARGGPERAARPPPAVRRPKAGVSR